jgi:hypothetical protein
MTPIQAAEAMREAILKTLADTFGLSPLGSLFKCIREIRLPALPESGDADGGEATERRSGHSKLVYDKNKRAIVAIDPRDAEIATLRAALEKAEAALMTRQP